MTERRVKSVGRPMYGRPQPYAPPKRRGGPRLSVGPMARRVVILVIIGVAGLVLLRQLFGISNIVVTSPTSQIELQSQVKKLVAKHLLQQSILTVNTEALGRELITTNPLVKSVSVQRAWPHTLRISVELKSPAMGWSTDNQAFLIDRDGTAIGMVPSGATYPVVYDGSNLPVKIGDKAVSSRFVGFITDLPGALRSVGIKATRYEVKDTTLDLYVTTDRGYRLIIDTSRPLVETLADLKLVLANLAAAKRSPAEYIDLRIAGKAYYK